MIFFLCIIISIIIASILNYLDRNDQFNAALILILCGSIGLILGSTLLGVGNAIYYTTQTPEVETIYTAELDPIENHFFLDKLSISQDIYSCIIDGKETQIRTPYIRDISSHETPTLVKRKEYCGNAFLNSLFWLEDTYYIFYVPEDKILYQGQIK